MNKRLRDVIRFLIFLAVGAGILYWIYTRQDAKYQEDCALRGIPAEACSLWDKLQTDFLSVDVFWILVVLLAFMVSNLSRAHRWLLLLRGIGMRARFGPAFWTIMLGYLANLFVPRIGEVIRGAVFGRYEKIPVEKVLGTIVVDRAMDVLSLLFAVVLALVLQFNILYGYLLDNLGAARLNSMYIAIVLVVGGGALLVLWVFRRRVKRTALFVRLKNVLIGFITGLKSIRKLDNIPLFLAHTVVIWIMYYLMTYLCFKAFVPTEDLGTLAALMTFVFGGLGIVFPSPGGMGTYHAMVMAALALYGIASEDAFSFANILYFSVQLFCNVVFGLLALLVLPLLYTRKS